MTPAIAPASAAARAAAPEPARATRSSFGAALRAQQAPPPPRTAASQPAAPRAALEALERSRRRLDDLLDAARRGRTFTAPELLALQAQAYRYSQTFEVASKVVEHGAQSVKQAVNTNV